MTLGKPLLALAAALAACEHAPTATPHASTPAAYNGNQAPVAVISVDSVRLVGSTYRHYLSGTGSYDPEGTSVAYSWTTDCPNGQAAQSLPTFSAQNGYPGGTCSVGLRVTDAHGTASSGTVHPVEDTGSGVE